MFSKVLLWIFVATIIVTDVNLACATSQEGSAEGELGYSELMDEIQRDQPCEKVTLVCSDNPKEICTRGDEDKHEDQARCIGNECKIIVPSQWCKSTKTNCFKPGEINRKDLVKCINEANPESYYDTINLCSLRHELQHTENPAWWPDCSNEGSAYWAQIVCLFNFYNLKCGTPELKLHNASYCNALLIQRCGALGSYSLQECKCEMSTALAPKTACPKCEQACIDQARGCSEAYLEDPQDVMKNILNNFCSGQQKLYCENNPNPN